MLSRFSRLSVFLSLVLISLAIGAAPPPKSVPIRPIKGGGGNKIPLYVPFGCDYTEEGIVVYSSRDIVGEVKVVDKYGETVAEGCGCFNPELSVPFEEVSGSLTVTIYIEEWGMTYVGYIE